MRRTRAEGRRGGPPTTPPGLIQTVAARRHGAPDGYRSRAFNPPVSLSTNSRLVFATTTPIQARLPYVSFLPLEKLMPPKITGSDLGLMLPQLSSLSSIFRTGLTHIYQGYGPKFSAMDDSWKFPRKKSLLYVSKPPAERCPINSLPPEILASIFILGQQMDLDPEPSRYAAEPGPDPDREYDDSAHVHDDSIMHSSLSDRSVDKPLPPEPIPVVDDDHDNSEWEDEDSEPDDDSDHGASSIDSILVDESFQVTVSHVCKHWREVALGTPALWSDIELVTGKHATQSYRRASTYLSRSKWYPLSIYVDVDERGTDDESVDSEQSVFLSPTTNAELQGIMDLLIPHTTRWRKFKLVAESYLYFHTALSRLSAAPPALLLEYLDLHHLEEDLEPEYLLFPYPSHKTPFVLFDNYAPKLQFVSLYGVHIDWNNTTFLKNLHSLELAYHSQDVRPSFDDFFTILRSSPGLRTLDLCMSGPCGFPHEWPAFLPPLPQDDHYHDPHLPASFNTLSRALDEHMILPKLHELKLGFQSPEELAAFFNRVSMPALHTLEVDLEDFEYTDFVRDYFIAPPKWQRSSSRESRFTNLKEFKIIQLPCTPKAIADLYATLVNLETIDFDFNTLDEPFWEVLIPMKVNGVTIPPHHLLPALHTMRVKGSCGEVLCQIVSARISVGLPLKKLYIDFTTEIDQDADGWLRENVEGVEYFEDSDEDDYSDDESASSVIEVEMDGFPL